MNPVDPSVWAIVSTYNPTPAISSLVTTLRSTGVRVILADNSTPRSPVVDALARFDDSVVALCSGLNRGLAGALNDGVAEATSRGAEIIMLWDQDSRPTSAVVDGLVSAFLEECGRAPLFLGATHVRRAPGAADRKDVAQRTPVGHLITASLVGRTADYCAVGPFREDFWVDMVDVDFSYRARRCGYRLLRANDLVFEHELGTPSRVRKVPGSKHRMTSGHAIWRQYWISRNGAILAREYRSVDRKSVRRLCLHRLDWFGRVLLAGPQRVAVLRAMIRGLLDARTGAVAPRYSNAFELAFRREIPQ